MSVGAEAGLAIMVWSCDLRSPDRAATPFVAAQAAAALDLRVHMLFAAQAVLWLLPQHGATPIGFGAQQLTLAGHLETSAALGIEIYACSQSLHALGHGRAALAPQCAGQGGMVDFIARGQAPGWRSLVF